jgi:4-hydroxybenzoate polyprenyltransferase
MPHAPHETTAPARSHRHYYDPHEPACGDVALPAARGHRGWRAYLHLLRPHQWTKNAFCLAGVLFGPGRLGQWTAWGQGVAITAAFCVVSSAVYILNDLHDRERDRLHPRKRHRPLASGVVSVPAAACLGVLLAGLGLAMAIPFDWKVSGCLVLYLANNLLYSFWLKHKAFFDVLSIALGFCLRMCAGVYALGDLPTNWITLCTFFLAVFLGFAKRRAELVSYESLPHAEPSHSQRPVLSKYSIQLLDSLLNNAAIMATMCYALFTSTSGKNPSLVITVPVVFYAIMHYNRQVTQFAGGEEPDRVLLKDFRIQASIGIWLVTYYFVTFGNVRWFH